MSGFGVSAQRAVIMYLCIMGAEILGRKYDASHGLAPGCLYLCFATLCNLSEWILFSFTALLAITVYSGLRSEMRKSNTNCIREEKKSYKRSCWDMVSGLLETIATESVFAIMADAIDGMVLL